MENLKRKEGRTMKAVRVFTLAIFLISLVSLGYPQAAPNYFECSVEKAKQGITNLLTGWLELPFQVYKGAKGGLREGEPTLRILGGFFGIFRGIIHGLGRTASGAIQLSTFFLPNPKDNRGVGVPLDSQYVWEEGEQYSLGEDGLSPIGEKAIRGLYNTGLGILDMPGQFIKGIKEGKPWIGLANSILFPAARIISGAFDLGTVLLPNSPEGYGYPLEEKYPWDALIEGNYYNEL
ncbi:MAG: hypothetical protein DRP61_03235 [Candidatus Omnitrophota bacterium]|nr:MAG: hypothetical protein DRP61_03235 [Candidatus Omnitrophota bacterium]RKY34439.1 MAG: hypothetical protein DRP69_04680 [Candidatus Omnitrophota bacterium]RKY44069.1 MAG: hypothetical protein DRP80_03420 [Candidatus Omnitrophota bacterium]